MSTNIIQAQGRFHRSLAQWVETQARRDVVSRARAFALPKQNPANDGDPDAA